MVVGGGGGKDIIGESPPGHTLLQSNWGKTVVKQGTAYLRMLQTHTHAHTQNTAYDCISSQHCCISGKARHVCVMVAAVSKKRLKIH